jgi:glycosyltransferase involved in cell wall biosynthesis
MHSDGIGVSYTCISLVKAIHGPGLETTHFVPTSDPAGRWDTTVHAMQPWLNGLAYRIERHRPFLRGRIEQMLIRQCKPGDLAYLWTHVTENTYRKLKERGVRIVLERINNHARTASRILEAEYTRLGLPVIHGIEVKTPLEHDRELSLADFVFCPSPMVVKSMLENGVAAEKLLETSYGWDPARITDGTHASAERPERDGIDVVFVGSANIRKGIHLLLRAWAQANLKGRLLIAGHVSDEIKALCKVELARPDVVQLGYVHDIGRVLREADVFAFPSLEEGGPQVSYEAMAAGLPVIVTPMAAGACVRAEHDGYVIEPKEADAWVEAIRRLARDTDLRRRFGNAGLRHAQDFTWEKVGQRRRELLLAAANQPQRPAAVAAGIQR